MQNGAKVVWGLNLKVASTTNPDSKQTFAKHHVTVRLYIQSVVVQEVTVQPAARNSCRRRRGGCDGVEQKGA